VNILDILFPKSCLRCHKSGKYLCDSCVKNTPFAETICPHCNHFSFYGKTHDQCKREHTLDGVISVWKYTGVVRLGITALKYKYAQAIARDLAESAIFEVIKYKIPKSSIFISVPLFKTKDNWRGFNQSELLAKELAIALGYSHLPYVLVRSVDTKPQVSLTKRERVRNMRGKFAVNTAVFDIIDKKRPIIIVDDVWTTGATLKECCKVLKQAGVREVYGLVLAQA